ncbi:DMP19 family protein [Sphingomonas sp.]|uniref:DMP19 family protein n=1 Tax=Sphingomonas sp. TaxID=28214 RepID=UPI003B3A09F5
MADNLIFLPEGSLGRPSDAVESFCWITSAKLSFDVLWNTDGTDDAINLYHAAEYEGEVNNGGHDQYFHNRNNHTPVYRSALKGLEMIGADAYARLVAAMITWAEQHPEEVAATPDTPRSSTLDRLDDQFFSLSKERSVRDFTRDWLSRSPKVRLIPKAEFERMGLDAQKARSARSDAVAQAPQTETAVLRGFARRLIDRLTHWKL